jgi:hypothetical protein
VRVLGRTPALDLDFQPRLGLPAYSSSYLLRDQMAIAGGVKNLPMAEGRFGYCPVAQCDFRIRLLKSLRGKLGSL